MYALKEAVKGMLTTRTMTLTSVVTITMALIIVGLFAVLTLFGNSFIDSVMKIEELNVYIIDSLSDADLLALDATVNGMPGVESTRILTKDDAARELQRIFNEDLLAGLGTNPLPRSIIVTMAPGYRMSDDIEHVAAQVRQYDGVESVEYGREWISRMDIIFLVFLFGEVLLLTIISSACLLIISNTISLTVLARRETIEIMRLVGATDSFIRRPFYYEGFFQGLISGIFAFGFLYGSYFWVRSMIPNLDLYFFMFNIHGLSVMSHKFILVSIIPIGAVMGLLGSFFALRGTS